MVYLFFTLVLVTLVTLEASVRWLDEFCVATDLAVGQLQFVSSGLDCPYVSSTKYPICHYMDKHQNCVSFLYCSRAWGSSFLLGYGLFTLIFLVCTFFSVDIIECAKRRPHSGRHVYLSVRMGGGSRMVSRQACVSLQ